jgi:hypothetical protein
VNGIEVGGEWTGVEECAAGNYKVSSREEEGID